MEVLLQTSIMLYVPLVLSVVLLGCLRIYPRLKTTIVLSSLWQIASLPWLDHIAQHFGCWTYFESRPILLISMPVTVYCSWVILWGVLAPITLGKLPVKHPVLYTLIIFLFIDFTIMPMFSSIVSLNSNWWAGEILLILGGLLPGLALAHWTLTWTKVCWRSFILSISFGLTCITLTPFLAGHTIHEVSLRLGALNSLHHILFLIVFFFITAPAVAAVQATTKLGKGTPIPIDPPRTLVTTSVYGYIANPMQISIILGLLVVSVYLNLAIYLILTLVAVIYCIGFAKWSEEKELEQRFGKTWSNYSAKVKTWRPSLLPNLDTPAVLYIDLNCKQCSEIADWFTKKNPTALRIQDASTFEGPELQAITYQHPDGTIDQSVSAITSALEHLHLGWAWISWMINYPGVSHLVQLSINLTQGKKKLEKINS